MTRLHDPDAPDPPIGEYSTGELGAMLRETRLSLGRELEEVSAELRIRLVYLQAIEAGRLDDLPGMTYATGFLRAYGDFLGLDGGDLVNRFKAAGMAMSQSPDLHLPSPVEEGRLPTGSVLLVAALLAGGAYGGWYYMSSQGQDPIETVAALPTQLAELVGIDGNDQPAEGADAPDGATRDADPRVTDGATAEATVGPAQTAVASPGDGASDAPDSEAEQAAAIDATGRSPADDTAAPSLAAPEIPAKNVASVSPPAPMTSTVVATTPPTAPPPAQGGMVPTPAETPPAETPPVETVARAAPPEPPAAPKPKPAPEDRAPARQPAPTAAPVAEAAVADPAPTATTIVAAAASGDSGEPARGRETEATAASAAAAHRVVLRANTATWVEVGAAEEIPVLSRLMRRGETFVVPSRPGLMMATGNAGAIDILVDGKAIPRLGPNGEVRKNVALDARSLLATSDPTR